MKDIKIPQSGSTADIIIKVERNLVMVGANGAGKTRLGSKIEQINSPTKRISAQRYLQLSEKVAKEDFETADSNLKGSYKNKPPVQPQNDYQQVLISLFAQESKRNEEVLRVIKEKGKITKRQTPTSIKEEVVEVWNFVFPYRHLNLENDKVRADGFSGTEMSDGEKVGLYLISQILLAEKDCILIIDEPELHLHKSLMVRLWNKLEEYRNDCTFIYITHDLGFAVSKPSSKLIWVQSYQDSIWNWKSLIANEVVPEDLYLEILGSREKILFVEGNRGSLDVKIYQAYYQGLTVIPREGCDKVIEAVKGLRGNSELHEKKVFGLIDRDFRPNAQILKFKTRGIFCTPLNKVENLFLIPEIVGMVCNHLSKTEKKEEIISEIRTKYIRNKKRIVFAASKYRMYRHLGERFSEVKSEAKYKAFKKKIFNQLDKLLVSKFPSDDANIIEILKAYPDKGLVREIQSKVDLSNDDYQNLVLSFFTSDKKRELRKILKNYLPKIK